MEKKEGSRTLLLHLCRPLPTRQIELFGEINRCPNTHETNAFREIDPKALLGIGESIKINECLDRNGFDNGNLYLSLLHADCRRGFKFIKCMSLQAVLYDSPEKCTQKPNCPGIFRAWIHIIH